jgi:hypothetical protein
MRLLHQLARRFRAFRALADDAGMSTAEYAVGTIAAVAFAIPPDSACLVRSHFAPRCSAAGAN